MNLTRRVAILEDYIAFNDSLSRSLDEGRIATLTTFGEDSMPHVTAVWFLWRDGALYIATSRHTGDGLQWQN